MARRRKYSCSDSTLVWSGNKLCDAADADSGVSGRLPAGLVAGTRTKLAKVDPDKATRAGKQVEAHELNEADQKTLHDIEQLHGQLRVSAKRAWPEDHLKRQKQFAEGVTSPRKVADIVGRARLAGNSANAEAAALDAVGWKAADTTKLLGLCDKLLPASETEDQAQADSKADTDALVDDANQSYDNLLVIQNAANIEHPLGDPAHAAAREKFLLGVFPPKDKGPDKPKPGDPPPP